MDSVAFFVALHKLAVPSSDCVQNTLRTSGFTAHGNNWPYVSERICTVFIYTRAAHNLQRSVSWTGSHQLHTNSVICATAVRFDHV